MDAPKHTDCVISVDGNHLRCPAAALRRTERAGAAADGRVDLATCWGPEGTREANARRLALCWNAHDALLKACDRALSHLEGMKDYIPSGDWDQEVVAALRAAVALGLGKQEAPADEEA